MQTKSGKTEFLKSHIGLSSRHLTSTGRPAHSAGVNDAVQLGPQKDNVQFQKLFFPSLSPYSQNKIYFFQRHVFPIPFPSQDSRCGLITARIQYTFIENAFLNGNFKLVSCLGFSCQEGICRYFEKRTLKLACSKEIADVTPKYNFLCTAGPNLALLRRLLCMQHVAVDPWLLYDTFSYFVLF